MEDLPAIAEALREIAGLLKGFDRMAKLALLHNQSIDGLGLRAIDDDGWCDECGAPKAESFRCPVCHAAKAR